MSSTENALPDTPVMRQYQELKNQHPQALITYVRRANKRGDTRHPMHGLSQQKR